MLKELIDTEQSYRDRADQLQEKILEKLRPIFNKMRHEYSGKDYTSVPCWMNELIDPKHKFAFCLYSTLDGYRIDEERGMLILNYYDKGYDCYDSSEFEIPLDIVEKELSGEGTGDETLVWYKGIIEDAYQRKQAKIKEREDRKKTKEYQQYLKLKEKYE